MSKYLNAKIYKIEDPVGRIYIGSTTEDTLERRYSKHKANYKKYKAGKYHNISVFQMFDTFGIENCHISLIEIYPCESRTELEKREGMHILAEPMVINKVVAGRTMQEWRQTVGSVQYQCVCGSVVTEQHSARHMRTKKHLNWVANI